MYWYAVLLVGLIYGSYAARKNKNQPNPTADKLQGPTSKEGGSIPVLFGSRRLKNYNCIDKFNEKATAIKKKSGK